MLLALEPMCLNLCIFSALLLGIQYLFFGAFNIVFTTNHDFNRWQVGLSFIGILIGMLAGISMQPLYVNPESPTRWASSYLPAMIWPMTDNLTCLGGI